MYRRQAYYYASAVFLLLLVVYSVAINKQPYIGLELKSVNGQWIVTSSDPDGQGYKSGVRVGDLILARELEYIIFAAVPIFLINFISNYFSNEYLNRINLLGRLMLTLMSVIILIVTMLQSVGIVHFISPLRKLVLVTVSIGVLFTLWNLGALLKLPKDKPEKNQANILLMGIVIGFLPFVFLTAIPIVFSFQPIMNAHVSSLFVSLIPATWYFAIVHKYLPDSHRLIGTIISYFVTGAIISFVVSFLLFTLKLSRTFNLVQYLSTLVLFVVIIVCFSLIRVSISKLLIKYLFPEGKQDFKKRILEFNESLSLFNEEGRMLEEVVKNLALEGAFIVVEDGKGGYLKKAVGIFLEKPREQIKLEEFFQANQRINLDVKMLPDDFPAELYIPFVSNEYICGIFLGHRYSHIKVAQDELPLITLISSQLAQRLITTFVIKELSKEIKELAQRSLNSQRRSQRLQGITSSLFRRLEKERKLIAREIHDGPLQLGLDLDRRLKNLVKEVSTDDKLLKDVSYMQELVEESSFELRSICNGLRPPSLSDLGLLPAIELMCEEIMLNELLLISLETVAINQEERFKEEVELAAYRFLQEGIARVGKGLRRSSSGVILFLPRGLVLPAICRTQLRPCISTAVRWKKVPQG